MALNCQNRESMKLFYMCFTDVYMHKDTMSIVIQTRVYKSVILDSYYKL